MFVMPSTPSVLLPTVTFSIWVVFKGHLKALFDAKCSGLSTLRANCWTHITSALQAVHCLPISFHLQFKMVVLIYKTSGYLNTGLHLPLGST